jgi:predicted aspartyl protease
MPHGTFPLSPDGIVLQAVFGLNGTDMTDLAQLGKSIPAPIQVRALVDTGSDVTAVAPHVVQRLGLVQSAIPGLSQTASGSVLVNIHRVSLSILEPVGRSGSVLVLPDLLVSELTTTLPSLDALIGMDVLRSCLFVLDGPGRQFILSS